ncbi:carboxypeptidase-like regulatory domain-containing protein [Klebsiella pneumoniae]|uniref:carboxypeptidase-like regulatory domain-containing protein n=1 Tax=Klebsiella pneumoniae TaxID=573 RepID=UPI000AA247AF|nr:carboxypeptidase-like regulatory domain-containing protein [Klebsiella pneumoniae]
MKKIITVALCVMGLSGCVPPQGNYGTQHQVKQVVKRPAFPVEEYAALPKKGTGVVKDELFGVTRGGDVKIGAGQSITLRPLTSYVRNTPKIDFQTQELEPIDKRISAYDRVINTDAQGKFEFDNVPPGEYSVFGMFSWYAGYMPQLVFLNKDITVKNGETVQVQP